MFKFFQYLKNSARRGNASGLGMGRPYMAHRDMRVISQLRKEKEKEKERYKCLQLDF